MNLCDRTIKNLIKTGELVIKPYKEENVQPSSIDLRLGEGFLVPDYHSVEKITLDDNLILRKYEGDKIIIPPKHFILGTTLEYLEIPGKLSGSLEGKSTIGRKGLFVYTAGHVNSGFKGNLTLEFFNAGDIMFELKSGIEICQLILNYLDDIPDNLYNGRYQCQSGVTGNK